MLKVKGQSYRLRIFVHENLNIRHYKCDMFRLPENYNKANTYEFSNYGDKPH